MNQKRLGALVAALSLLAVAPTAYAKTGVDLGLTAKIETKALRAEATSTLYNGADTLRRSATSSTAGKATPNASAEGKANANINSRLNVNASTSASSSLNTMNGGTTSSSTAMQPTFTLTRSDIASTTATVMNPADVSSSSDFQGYARSLMASDENVAKIESGDNFVSLWYKEPAKLLGIVPGTVTVEATVKSDGTVTVNYPWWYSIFVKDDTKPTFENSLSMTAGTIARAEGGTTLSSNADARLINALYAGMKERRESTSTGTTTPELNTY